MVEINDRFFRVLGISLRQYASYKKYTDYNITLRSNSEKWAQHITRKNRDNDCTIVPIRDSEKYILTIFQDDFDRPWIDLVLEEAPTPPKPVEIPFADWYGPPKMARVAELA